MAKDIDDKTRIELEAAAFRGLVAHLQKRTDTQNIDIMNLAGFCRNCLSKWYMAAAEVRGFEISYDEAREIIYGLLDGSSVALRYVSNDSINVK